MRRQHQNLGRLRHGLDAGDYLKAIEPGHGDIEDDQVRAQLTRQPHRVNTIVCLADDIEPFLAQQHAHGGSDERMVVNHHDFVHRLTSRIMAVG